MRYRIGEQPTDSGTPLDQGAFTSIAVLSFLIGIVFVVAGMRSKHYWLAIWGSGLSICSVVYLVLFGFAL